MPKKKHTLSVVIPCYKSPSTLVNLVHEIIDLSNQINLQDVILVFDGDPQDSKVNEKVFQELSSKVKCITLAKNFGQHNAIYAGILHAKSELIATMDDDSQHLPKELMKMLDALNPKVDVIYGVPIVEEHGFVRSFSSRLVKNILWRTGVEHARQISAFRIFKRDLITGLGEIRNPFVQIDVLLGWTTSRVGSVEVQMNRRSEGQSNYNLSKLLTYAYNLVTGYSVKPLRFVSYVGILSFLFGISLFAYSLVSYFVADETPSGFTFIAASVSLFSGIQLLSLGVISEYLGRIFAHTSGQPIFRPIPSQSE